MAKKKKHPKDMTSEELLRHVFHPKIVKHVKEIVRKHNEKHEKKATR